MDIHKIKNLPADELEALLVGENIGWEETAYNRPLSEDEILVKKDDLSRNIILKSSLEDELKEVKREYKDKIDPIKAKVSEDLKAIKTKSEEVIGKVYKMPDYENQMIYMVDPKGNVISSRRMMPGKRQFTITSQINKAI